jgi:hypothetical protein
MGIPPFDFYIYAWTYFRLAHENPQHICPTNVEPERRSHLIPDGIHPAQVSRRELGPDHLSLHCSPPQTKKPHTQGSAAEGPSFKPQVAVSPPIISIVGSIDSISWWKSTKIIR